MTNFNTSNQTFRKLMGNGLVYRVPPFQRDYSWTEEEWEDLWRDIEVLLEPNSVEGHYLGYLVLQSRDERRYEIIDGQQRLTTLTLLILAVLSSLQSLVEQGVEAADNQRRIEELRKTYVGFVDPVSLASTPKLTLNRHNNPLYQTYLVPLQRAPRRNLKESEHLLRKAFEWFEGRIQARYGDQKSGAELARFVDQIADRLFFTVISVTDELNAFKVFETLNARGVRLSSTDLLKNYFFSVVHAAGGHEEDMRSLEDLWEQILGKLGSENVPDFLRVFWNSRHALARHNELFKRIRADIRDRASVFALMRDLDRDAEVYWALGKPHDSGWSPEQRHFIDKLAVFSVRQPYPLLLAARRKLSDSDFTVLLRACVVLSFRYNVIGGLAPTEQERVYNQVAAQLFGGQMTSLAEVIRALRPIYPNDAQFKAAFTEKQVRTTTPRNRRVVRYILFEIEQHLSGASLAVDSERYSVEHVLPEHPGDGWEAFSDDDVDRLRYRLGNLTLLPTAANRQLGNGAYRDKAAVYAGVDFALTRGISERYEDWTPESIAHRQHFLAEAASAIWRVSQLD